MTWLSSFSAWIFRIITVYTLPGCSAASPRTYYYKLSEDSIQDWNINPFLLLFTGDSRYVDFAYLDTIIYVEVIFHSQHLFSMYLCISTPSMSKTVNMKQWVSRGDFSCPKCIFCYICYFLCRSQNSALTLAPYCLFPLCTCITWGAKTFQSKTIKVIYLLSIEQLILYLAQLNPWLFWYEIIIPIKRNDIDNQLFTFNWPTVIMLIVNIIRGVRLKPKNTKRRLCNFNDWTV